MKTLLVLFLFTIVHADDTPKQWPSEPFQHVVAYCYDFSQDQRGSSITFPDGSLHKGVIRATTIRLNDTQTVKLRALLSKDSENERGEVECYDPHHAFVFYDQDWKVVASVDICFLCDNYVARPRGVSNLIDLVALEALCREFGLPMLEDSSNYTALYQQEQPKKETGDLKKETVAPKKNTKHQEDSDPFAE